MVKFIFRIMMCISLLAMTTACSKDEEAPVVYQEVNYATMNGTWMLTEFNGAPLQEGQYVYITFNRKEHTFQYFGKNLPR